MMEVLIFIVEIVTGKGMNPFFRVVFFFHN